MKTLCTGAALVFLSMRLALADPFELDLLSDGLTLGAGVIFAGSSLFLLKPALHYLPPAYDPEAIPWMDSFMVNAYSPGLETASYLLLCGSLLMPAILALAPSTEWLTVGVMYTESLLFSFGMAEALNGLAQRASPYMYWDNPPQNYVDDGDYLRSFPSVQTTMAFTGATFTGYVFAAYFPDSPLRWPVLGVSYALALSSAVTRIASGTQFLSDVLAGACLGAAGGFLVPWLHEREEEQDALTLTAGVRGFTVTFRY